MHLKNKLSSKDHEKVDKNHHKKETQKEPPKEVDRSGLYGSGDSLRNPGLVLFYNSAASSTTPTSSNPSPTQLSSSTTRIPLSQIGNNNGVATAAHSSTSKKGEPTPIPTPAPTTTSTTKNQTPPLSVTASPSEGTPNTLSGPPILPFFSTDNNPSIPDSMHQAKSPSYSTRATLTTPSTSLSKFGLNNINEESSRNTTATTTTDPLRNNGVILFYNPTSNSSKGASSSNTINTTTTSSTQATISSLVSSKSSKKKDKSSHSKVCVYFSLILCC